MSALVGADQDSDMSDEESGHAQPSAKLMNSLRIKFSLGFSRTHTMHQAVQRVYTRGFSQSVCSEMQSARKEDEMTLGLPSACYTRRAAAVVATAPVLLLAC
jgi:hypothetical protein